MTRKDSFMTLRQWILGVSVAGVVGVTGMTSLAKPPDLPVEQGFFCRDKETPEIRIVDPIEPQFRDRQPSAQDENSTKGEALESTEGTHRVISTEARSEMCADRVPMQVRQE